MTKLVSLLVLSLCLGALSGCGGAAKSGNTTTNNGGGAESQPSK